MSSARPKNDDGQGQFSEKPMPNARPASRKNVLRGDELFKYVVDCLRCGMSKTEVCQELIAMGYSPTEAGPWVEQVAEWRRNNLSEGLPQCPGAFSGAAPSGSSDTESGGKANMWVGLIVCLIGIFFTVGTYTTAAESGGTYIVAYGAIAWGATHSCAACGSRASDRRKTPSCNASPATSPAKSPSTGGRNPTFLPFRDVGVLLP